MAADAKYSVMSINGADYTLFDENGNEAEFPTAVREGWTFVEWKDADDKRPDPFTIFDGDVFYAQWIDDIAPDLEIASTSNTASSQTVTMTMKDGGSGLAAYYAGLYNPEENDVDFTSNSSESVSVDIANEGMWYFAAQDESGNMTVIAKTFYRIELDADGGSVSPTVIIAAEGTEIELPEPSKTGYTFIEWEEVE